MFSEYELKSRLSAIIVSEIKARGWTQEYTALEMDLSQSTISLSCRNICKRTSVSTMTEIVKKLGYKLEINLVKL